MDGVTILNTYQTYSIGGVLLLFAGIAGIAFVTIAAVALFDENVCISGFLVGLAIILIGGCLRINRTETRYEVVLNDRVSWTEFSEVYDVLKVRGKILEVKEK